MRKFVWLSIAWISLGLLVQAQTPSQKTEMPAGKTSGLTTPRNISSDEHLDWSKVDPIEFLELLKKQAGPTPFFTLWTEPPPGWITAEHVEQLLKLMKSREPAAHVVMARCSQLPFKNSTVGMQAMFLIEGFRRGSYPPSISSEGFKGKPSEYREWWTKRQTARDALP